MCANLSLQGKDNAEAGTWWGMRTLCLNTGIDQACTESICIKQAEGKGRRLSRLTMLRQEMSEVAAVTDKEQEWAASHLGIWEIRRDHFFHGLLEKWHCYTHEVISNAYGKSLVWTELWSRNGLELSCAIEKTLPAPENTRISSSQRETEEEDFSDEFCLLFVEAFIAVCSEQSLWASISFALACWDWGNFLAALF